VRVLIVSGIWPPDVGGPASHAPAVADFLSARGHTVDVVITADRAPAQRTYPVRWTPRRIPVGLRHLHTLVLLVRRALSADVIYTTGMFGRSGLAARLTRTPIVVKLTGDPAFERLHARGAARGDVDTFQAADGGLGTRVLRGLRDDVVRRADHVYTPSTYLAELAITWGARSDRVSVLPNPAPAELPVAPREELRARLGLDGPTLAFAGRLTAQKSLDVLVRSLVQCEGVSLVVAGDGDELSPTAALVDRLGLAGRVRLLGPLNRAGVLELFAAADAAVLSSSWENFPHSVVEALAVGTPVIATRVGGVPEVVVDGENGLLVPPGDPTALADAVKRYFADADLRARLRAAATPSVEPYRPDRLFAELEQTLARAARQ
jgi:glycosyltransferase involved in cell wall biosynthesis